MDDPHFGKDETNRLEEAVKMGCRGLKNSKFLGLRCRDKTGKFVPVDDPRIDPIWEKCAELGMSVMIHVSDPKAFFTAMHKYNERYDELVNHPDWLLYGEKFPTKEGILAQRNRLFAKHPTTIFIGAHVGNLPEKLHRVAMWLDVYKNFYVDIDARISELREPPYTAQKFLIKYQDYFLFGTDTTPQSETYQQYYRFLEADDEYIDPTPAYKQQWRYKIYGLFLPDKVLEKIYYKNALKIFA